jgi:hypothetical protein
MRFYPQLSGPRSRTVARDVIVVLLLVVFAWAGIKVHDTVIELNALSRGVTDAGQAINGGFDRAAEAVGDVPLVGGALRDRLEGAGGATGGNVAAAGRAGESAVSDTASLLGWITFGLPTLVLLAFYLPLRGLQIRRMNRAQRMLGLALSPERRRLLAMRAAFGLSWSDLGSFSKDPIGDLEAGRLDPLVDALYADAGLRPPAPAA